LLRGDGGGLIGNRRLPTKWPCTVFNGDYFGRQRAIVPSLERNNIPGSNNQVGGYIHVHSERPIGMGNLWLI
jgi:hypothetical protein